MIERTRLSELLDACGADPARWPEDEREAARAVLAEDAALQIQAGREAVLDEWLKDWAEPAPRPQAIEALLAASRATPQQTAPKVQPVARPEPRRRRERWLANGGAVGLAASLMALLMAVGEPAPPPQHVDMSDPAVANMAFSTDLSEGWL